MHTEVMDFVKEVKSKYPHFFTGTRVLEVGSQIINGTVRTLFKDPVEYVGLDLAPGHGVDIVRHASAYERKGHFDVVISTEALEHDRNWRKTLWSMYKNLHPGGLMVVTCASINRKEHGTTKNDPGSSPHTLDYYGNISANEFSRNLPMDLFDSHLLEERREHMDLMFYGIKYSGL